MVSNGGCPKISDAHDRFSRGAIEYLNKLDEDSIHYHYVKPFVGGPDFSPFFQDFYAFLNIIELLNLPPKAKILDFGCGTGWISIYLAKLGHLVTGIDISPDFISIANTLKNNEKIYPFRGQKELTCSFFVHDVDKEPFTDESKFDCVILYSTLHHLVYPEKILKDIIEQNLEENGKIIIYEGVKPPNGSVYEKKNYELIEKYDTLERPFTPTELLTMLKDCGYDRITFYEPINGLFTRDVSTIKRLVKLIKSPPTMNAVLAFKPANSCRAEILLKTNRNSFLPGENLILKFEVKNIGRITWNYQPTMKDNRFITLGARLYKEGKWHSDSISRSFLPKDILPNEKVSLEWKCNAPEEKGQYSLIFDMVYENYTWFQRKGSKELIYDFTVK